MDFSLSDKYFSDYIIIIITFRLRHLQQVEICYVVAIANTRNNNSVALVFERTIPTKQSPLISEVSANFCG
jgi:hypothetical protein